MRKLIGTRTWRLSIAVILLLTLFGPTASAQEPDTAGGGTGVVGPPAHVELEWMEEPPVPTDEQQARMERWAELTPRSGPALGEEGALASAGPEPGTESQPAEDRERSGQPLLPGDAVMFKTKMFGIVVPPGFGSNAMGSSTGMAGLYGFYTGDWFAARSVNGGGGWLYVDPFADFPDFCAQQITTYDEARDIFLWLRPGCPDENGENAFMLSVSHKDATTWFSYPLMPPTDVDPLWTHQSWDYPHIQLGADYAYITWNMYDWNGTSDPNDDFWVRTIILRISLDDLAANIPFTYQYYWTSEWFTFVPVQGAYHTLYWASNWPVEPPWNSRISVWKWQEDEEWTYIEQRIADIAAWDYTEVGSAHCPLEGEFNWLAESDQRILTGARYSVNTAGEIDPKILGRKALGWWWNVREGGLPLPYIEGVAFFEDSWNIPGGPLVQLPGWLGRPYVWSPGEYCFAYPSISPNKRQDLGAVFNYAEAATSWRPHFAYALADDYVLAPPSWAFYTVLRSKGMPADSRWGAWNTVREFEPTQKTWIGAGHYIKQPANCVNCGVPLFIIFGRERDRQSWYRWHYK